MDVADNLFVGWTSAGNLYVCPLKDGACTPGIVNVSEQTGTVAHSIAMVPFSDGPELLEVRSGGVAFGASRKDAGHLFAAYNAGADPIRVELVESLDGGLTWDGPVVVSGRPLMGGGDRFMPALASQDDGTVLVTYYDRTPDPDGSLVQQGVAIRYPGESAWVRHLRQQAGAQLSDLSLLPQKCGDPSWRRFIGDYQAATGGRTHVHALRVDALGDAAEPAVWLQHAAISGSSWW